ncbi:acyl-CoA N-acyltransferase, partial [Testicularia cyperi]
MRRECNDGAHSSDGGAPTPTGSRQTSPTVAERIVRQRSRDGGAGSDASPPPPPPPRNIERVLYGNFDIKTWYYSPFSREVPPPLRMLWVCEGCFKYMKTYNAFAVHKKLCPHTHPPGRKLYQRGAHIIWEVDGAEQKLYCQNLSLFGKLFIDHKTIYFDVEPFLFYILTDASASFDHPLGFFSKEKNSYDDYNLACIITFPPFQRKSFGTLMIEFSYFLSARQGMLGTPERPLSDLGHRGYLAFWSSVVLRALL